MPKRDEWETVLNLSNEFTNDEIRARIHTSGSGVYVSITKLKDGDITDHVLLFPEAVSKLLQLASLVRIAEGHDQEIRKRKNTSH